MFFLKFLPNRKIRSSPLCFRSQLELALRFSLYLNYRIVMAPDCVNPIAQKSLRLPFVLQDKVVNTVLSYLIVIKERLKEILFLSGVFLVIFGLRLFRKIRLRQWNVHFDIVATHKLKRASLSPGRGWRLLAFSSTMAMDPIFDRFTCQICNYYFSLNFTFWHLSQIPIKMNILWRLLLLYFK